MANSLRVHVTVDKADVSFDTGWSIINIDMIVDNDYFTSRLLISQMPLSLIITYYLAAMVAIAIILTNSQYFSLIQSIKDGKSQIQN